MYELSKTKVSKKNNLQISSRSSWNILGKVDDKVNHKAPVDYHEKDNVTFTTTSAARNANNPAIGEL